MVYGVSITHAIIDRVIVSFRDQATFSFYRNINFRTGWLTVLKVKRRCGGSVNGDVGYERDGWTETKRVVEWWRRGRAVANRTPPPLLVAIRPMFPDRSSATGFGAIAGGIVIGCQMRARPPLNLPKLHHHGIRMALVRSTWENELAPLDTFSFETLYFETQLSYFVEIMDNSTERFDSFR